MIVGFNYLQLQLDFLRGVVILELHVGQHAFGLLIVLQIIIKTFALWIVTQHVLLRTHDFFSWSQGLLALDLKHGLSLAFFVIECIEPFGLLSEHAFGHLQYILADPGVEILRLEVKVVVVDLDFVFIELAAVEVHVVLDFAPVAETPDLEGSEQKNFV